jgi:hypothetical protein
MLAGGPSVDDSVVTGALLGLLTLVLARALGRRLRQLADLARPPDVLFPLDHPG